MQIKRMKCVKMNFLARLKLHQILLYFLQILLCASAELLTINVQNQVCSSTMIRQQSIILFVSAIREA